MIYMNRPILFIWFDNEEMRIPKLLKPDASYIQNPGI